MHPGSPLPRILVLFVLLAIAPETMAEKLVVVRSTVTGGYLDKRMMNGQRQPQSYVFMAGRFFPGTTHDNSLQKTSFRTIAERLALDLRQQEFYPAESLAKADLLLIVHWGVTFDNNRDSVAMSMSMENLTNLGAEAEMAQRDWEEARASGDFLESDAAQGRLADLHNQSLSTIKDITTSQRASDGEDNATLLGLAVELQKPNVNPFGDERLKTLYDMTLEERYFVIVAAYDAPSLINGKKLKRVWTLRASIRSAGVNFHQALDRMGNIASRYFGTRQDGVTFDYTGDREHKGTVVLKELQILGAVETPR